MKSHSRIAALGLLLAATVPAAATDFTFEVPVEVHKLPAEVDWVYVDCELRQDAVFRVGNVYGRGVRPTDGSFVGTITVAFDVPPLPDGTRVDPRRAHNYLCSLRFVRSDRTVWTGPAAPGAVQFVSGPIPGGH